MARQANQEAINRIQAARNKSLKLMQLEANGTLDKIARGHKDGINNLLAEGNSSLTDSLMTTSINRKTQPPQQNNGLSVAASNVPSAIREAFMKNPIDDSSLYSAFGNGGEDVSFLNEMAEQTVAPTPPTNIREIVNEGLQQYSQPQVQPLTSGVDYPMIRTIVEEIVRKYAQSLNKKIISESKGSVNEVNTIAIGKTFKFLDSQGNIYECVMKKVGNINNKKNVNG